MIKKLVYSLIISISFCFSCSKIEKEYKNPVFSTFFKDLENKTPEKFYESYYIDKPSIYRASYIIVLKDLKKYDSQFIITDYNEYKGVKPNIDGATADVYIIENKEMKDKIIVKIENDKIKYLIPIFKGKEDIIGWL